MNTLSTSHAPEPTFEETPRLPAAAHEIKGLGLDQVMMITTIVMVVVIVVLMATLFAVTTQSQFNEAAQSYTTRMQGQARELGRTVSQTLSLTSAAALRDNNYAQLNELSAGIVASNPNVLRIRILDSDGQVAADSDPSAPRSAEPVREAKERWVTGSYKSQPIFEYHQPIQYSSSSKAQGAVILTYSLEPLLAEMRELERIKRTSVRRTTTRSAVLGIGFVLIAAVLAAYQSRRITRPLGALTEELMRLSQGDLDTRFSENTRASREVRMLGSVFNYMADRIEGLMQDVRQKAQLEREMSLARTVQNTLLPELDAMVVGPLRIAGVASPADFCGGDWWLRSTLDERRLLIGIGDVTGHGVATALIASSAVSGLTTALKMRSPQEVNARILMRALNETIYVLGRSEYQMSCSLAIFDSQSSEIEIVSGAHPVPLIFNRTTRQVSSFTLRGPLVGAASNAEYTSKSVSLNPGDVIIWYTDGLIEARNPRGNPFGSKTLASVAQQYGDLPCEELRDAILREVRNHLDSEKQQDDVTVVVAEYVPHVSPT